MRLRLWNSKKSYGKINWFFLILSLVYGFILATNQYWAVSGLLLFFPILFILFFVCKLILRFKGNNLLTLLNILPILYALTRTYAVSFLTTVWDSWHFDYTFWQFVQALGVVIMLYSLYLLKKKEKIVESRHRIIKGRPFRFTTKSIAKVQIATGIVFAVIAICLFFHLSAEYESYISGISDSLYGPWPEVENISGETQTLIFLNVVNWSLVDYLFKAILYFSLFISTLLCIILILSGIKTIKS